ncbi:MAG TPA: hypothetical protein VGE66_14095 [Chitinophagaceae bacterium]
MTNNIFQECIDIVKELVGHEYLYFDTAIEVKTTPHSFPFSAWAVCVSPQDDLYVMDSDEEWHQVELDDNNAALVIGSLYQRLRLMRIQYAKAS